jgi:predicted metal-dependent peptidase
MSEQTVDRADASEDKVQEIARQALVSAGLMNPNVKRVRIPKRFEELNLNWIANAPFFSEFLFRFNYFETKDIPTAAVGIRQSCINFYFNPDFFEGGHDRPMLGPDRRPIIKLDAAGNPMIGPDSKIMVETELAPPMTNPEFEGLVIHEIEHLLRLHHERSLGDHMVFNIAGDMLINDSITKLEVAGRKFKPVESILNKIADGVYTCTDENCISLPSGGIYLETAKKNGFVGKETSEELYHWLMDTREDMREQYEKMLEKLDKQKCQSCGGSGKKNKGGDGEKPEDGSGGQKPEKGEKGDQPDDGSGGQQPEQGEGGQQPEQGDGGQQPQGEHGHGGSEPCPDCGGSGHQGGEAGDGSGMPYGDLFDILYGSGFDTHITQTSDQSARDTVGSLIEAAKMRGWGKITGPGRAAIESLITPAKIPWRQLLTNALSAYVHGYGNEKESSWSRRNRRMLPFPGYRRIENRVKVYIDVSGSISQHEIKTFFAQIERIIKDVSQMTVSQWDTQIKDTFESYKRGDWKKIKMRGGGGTDVQCVFDHAKESGGKDMLVVFTDGCFDMGFDTFGQKVVWCVTTDIKVPHGKNIFCDISKK